MWHFVMQKGCCRATLTTLTTDKSSDSDDKSGDSDDSGGSDDSEDTDDSEFFYQNTNWKKDP